MLLASGKQLLLRERDQLDDECLQREDMRKGSDAKIIVDVQ